MLYLFDIRFSVVKNSLLDELVQEVRLLRILLSHLERPEVLLPGRKGAGPHDADGLR